jgi:multiple sugar transport system permease protein
MKRFASYGLLIALAIFLVSPLVWMLLVSLHPSKAPIPPLSELVPRNPAWDNYALVLLRQPDIPVLRFFLNSAVVTLAVVLSQMIVCSMAAYGFARVKFRGREPLFCLFLGSMMFSGPVTQLPVYLLVRSMGILDTYWALIIPGISSAFNVFLMRQAFLAIPFELDEAARMDGAGDWLIYRRVVLPLGRASVATAAAFTFFAVWTDFFWPLLATNRMEMRTLEVGLSVFKNTYGGTNWPLQMTAAVLVMLPLVLVFLFSQRFFTKGITMGSIK